MPQNLDCAIVFTGHRIDSAGRAHPRFPPSAEDQVRHAIRAAVAESEVGFDRERLVGIAGGASGGDLLFHEVCLELGISTRLVLALPAEAFLAASVAGAGSNWVERFRALMARLGADAVTVIPQHAAAGDAVWEQTNRAMIQMSLDLASEQTLIALWDGNAGDGPGGTAAMIALARDRGVQRIVTIPMHPIVTPR